MKEGRKGERNAKEGTGLSIPLYEAQDPNEGTNERRMEGEERKVKEVRDWMACDG